MNVRDRRAFGNGGGTVGATFTKDALNTPTQIDGWGDLLGDRPVSEKVAHGYFKLHLIFL